MLLHTVFSEPGPVEAEILRELAGTFVVKRTVLSPVVLRSLEGGQGEPLLLLHDRLHSATIWAPLLKPLAERFRVIAVDLPGLGQSSSVRFAGKDARAALRFFLEPLIALVQERGLSTASTVAVVGHSLGGLLAQELVASGAMKPEKIALIAPLGLTQSMSPAARLFYQAKPERLVSVLGKPLFAQALAALRGHALTPPLAALEAELLSELGGKSAPARAFNALVPLSGSLYEATRSEALSRVRTLLLWGDRDPVLPVHAADEAAQRLGGAQLQILEGLGHAPHLEDPARVWPHLRAFLSA